MDDTTDTRYQIASVSKQFTAAAVLLLVQDRTLRLDDPVHRWIDDCPDEWHGITLHHLLTHTSGLGHWDDYPMIDLAQRVEPDALRETFHRLPLRFPPGQGWRYSSPGYVLLAQTVERAAGVPYRRFLADRVLVPLGLTRTFAGTPRGQTGLADGHDAAGEPLPTWELDVVGMGTGDVWSTAGDLLGWLDALQEGRLLDEPYRTLMLTEQARTGMGPEAGGYGFGVFVGQVRGQRWWHHDGHNAGFKAFVAYLPESRRRLVVLSNTEATDASVLAPLVV
ncbi:serine hydrolase [Micromonospora echinofusca]|uniref:Serine hydrolase n=1 Tax=Micromonospora echinofusca TaxID=47858 RepID=A0ABS3VZS3_MICEH|nr:serine hydrolase domain-containing protein [Micromonospora echinofusca]MBO4210023.1 serine hydrolase [Micromonospora echinofusca]